ncbi:unnamed protein product [Fusarium graminearum]|uniref:Chromosome 1, complete genome n=1 Tax=Gibberella zeae (strain ATCC MYA-4620 / CBS 123657 / FGSC 9075 / NRRL 31084 / PH-1) TaxID=229533 RepID=A0A098D086_GIBZE|nr:unnamed protein product [Fusarium graminearum]CZS75575.1 unnamed protein product [Fusarium graminearum]
MRSRSKLGKPQRWLLHVSCVNEDTPNTLTGDCDLEGYKENKKDLVPDYGSSL